MRRLALALTALSFAVAIPAVAQEGPPARVGRVSLVAGELAFFGPGDADWSAAKVNLPVAEGSWFATDPQSRAQLRIGPDAVDLAPDTQIDFANLRQGFMQVAVTQGRLYLRLRRGMPEPGTSELDLARGGVWLSTPGVYDIDSGDADHPTRITVLEGRARFVGGGIDQTINRGSQFVVSGSDVLAAGLERAGSDEFDRWSRSHDYREPRFASRVSLAMTGVEDLAGYGTWSAVPNYGTAWFPRSVPAGWAPYREGHWVWIEPWGWNWVDDEPWGFAPFHYGRWARIGYRWAWVPGEYVPEPVYAPALVAFIPPPAIETAVQIDVADAGPPIGWFPLAPDEVYWPSYTQDPGYIRNVNITNVSITKITNITNVIVNQPASGPPPQVAEQRFANQTAATVVPSKVFTHSAPVAAAALAVPAAVLQQVKVAVKPPPAVAPPVAAAAQRPAPAAPGRETEPASASVAKATPAHPPVAPKFSNLAPAPRLAPAVPQATRPAAPPPGPTPPSPAAHAVPPAGPGAPGNPPAASAKIPPAPAAALPSTPPATTRQPATAGLHPPPAPNVTRPPPPAAPLGHEPAGPNNPPGPAASAPPSPAHPQTPPNFGHLAPERPATHAQAPTTIGHPPAPGQQPPTATPGVANVPPAQKPSVEQELTKQRAAEDAARQKAAQEARQKAASDAATQAAQQHAAQAAAQQRAAQEAQQRAAQATAQQRAAQEAQQRAAQETQQRAAQAAAQQRAAQEAQQRSAAQAAAQQRAAQEAQQRAAQAAAQQRAAQEAQQRAAQAAAQQRAAQEAQQRAAAQAAAQQQHAAQHRPDCGHPGVPPCPR